MIQQILDSCQFFIAEEAERLRPRADELGSLRAPLQHPEAHAEDSVLAAQGRGQEDHSSGPWQARRIWGSRQGDRACFKLTQVSKGHLNGGSREFILSEFVTYVMMQVFLSSILGKGFAAVTEKYP